MEKETLLSKLRAKIGNPDDKGFYKNGVSDRTLNTYVDVVCAGVPDDATDASIGELIKVVDAMGGQMRHQVAETVKEVAPQSNGDSNSGGNNPNTGGGDDVLSQILLELKSVRQENNEIKARLENSEKGKTLSEYRSSLIQAMKLKGADKDAVIEVALGGVELDTTKNVEEVVDSYLGLYDKQYARFYGEGESPRQVEGNGSGSKNDEYLDSYFAKKASEGKMPQTNK